MPLIAKIICCLVSAQYKPVEQWVTVPKHSWFAENCHMPSLCAMFEDVAKLLLTNEELEDYSDDQIYYAILPADRLTHSYQPWHLCSGHSSLDGCKKADNIAKEGKRHNSS